MAWVSKRYGEGKSQECVHCGHQATTFNESNFPTCVKCKTKPSPVWKCACGDIPDLLNGKYGLYFNCINCGNVNYNKMKELNTGGHYGKRNKLR